MAENIIGSLLAQSLPTTAVATDAFTALLVTEITMMKVANVSGIAATFRIFHADTAQAYAAGNALYYDIPIAAATTYTIEAANQGTGIFMAKSGKIGVQSSVASGITFSIYGRTREGR